MRVRLVIAVLAATALAGSAVAVADGGLSAQTQAATDVTAASAVLHGSVDPGGDKTTYWFELGTTTDYGIVTPPANTGQQPQAVAVTSAVGGLDAGTTYHVRVVASSGDHVAQGDDTTFTTAGSPAAQAASPGGTVPPATVPSLPPAATPELGHSVGLAAKGGAVAVRLPGAPHAVALQATASVPVGSIVDTRHGSIDLTTTLPDGTTQTGTFHGGLFQVLQPAGSNGLTELVLRGPLPICPTGGARAAAATKKRPPRALWGHDNHGRFRTRASNSVITVRGTTWYVADRCDGTLTRVTQGSVAVRDLRRHRTVVVRAGHRYLAKRH
jgi:hypothetical protein